jgi:peptidyl-prolyl cis-trans isomerase C
MCPTASERDRYNRTPHRQTHRAPNRNFPMNSAACIRSALAVLLALICTSSRAELPPDVLVRNRWAEITRADYEGAIARVPSNMRDEFRSSPKRVQISLNSLLVTKTLAAQARMRGTSRGTGVAADATGAEADSALAKAELERTEKEASEDFDTRKSAFEAKALELYKLHPEKYQHPAEVRFSDISILRRGRNDAEARRRAAEAHAQIVAGADFASVARQFSDDVGTRDKGGALPLVTADRLSTTFATANNVLKNVGDVSEPIKGPYAYHVVRLEERRDARPKSFDEARASIMDTLRKQYVAEQRERRIQEIFADPQIEVNQPLVDSLVKRKDPRLLLRPDPLKAPAASTPK